MQRGRQGYFKERALFYTSRLISGQAPKGRRSEWAYNLSGVYLVALLEAVKKKGLANDFIAKTTKLTIKTIEEL